jgi:hypothetical protein
MVRAIDEFSVAPAAGAVPQSDLLWRGEPTGLRVDGISLERQWDVGGGYLLFLTEDSPYEEGLHIYLLDQARRVADALEIASPYASGILRDVEVEGDAAISFVFFGDDRWRLDVHPGGRPAAAARVDTPARRKSGVRGARQLAVQRVRT